MHRAVKLASLLALACIGEFTAWSPALADGRVYLLRGLFDLSAGLDDLAIKIETQLKVRTVVASYVEAAALARQAIEGYRDGSVCPVVIVGHSFGADAALGMADQLATASVPVSLIVAFSPAETRDAPANVARLVNYYQSNSYWNHVYGKGRGFVGSIANIDLAAEDDIHHFNIEKHERLHAETIAAIAAVSRTSWCSSVQAARGRLEAAPRNRRRPAGRDAGQGLKDR